MMKMLVADDSGPVKMVDLLATHTPFVTSVREALLYLDYGKAVAPKSSEISKNIKCISEIKVK